jgi:hypothetical protein
MLLAGRFRRTSFWLWSTPSRNPLLVVVRADRPSLVERMRSLFGGESTETRNGGPTWITLQPLVRKERTE